MGQNKALLSLLRSSTLRDRIMLINVLLFFWIGGAILYRAFFRHASWLAYLIGFGFLLFGSYRVYLFYKVLSRSGRGAEASGK